VLPRRLWRDLTDGGVLWLVQGIGKKEFTAVNHGDSAIWNMANRDPNNPDGVTIDEWMGYLITTHRGKRATLKGSGDKWFMGLMHKLELSLDEYQLLNYKESVEEAMQRTGPTEAMITYARMLYTRIGKLSHDRVPGVSKPDLVKANRGDYGTFERMDTDADGSITIQEWCEFLQTTHAEKRKKKKGTGDKWLKQLLGTLNKGCLDEEQKRQQETPEEAALRTGPTDVDVEHAFVTYTRMASFSEEDGVTKRDLVMAHRGDHKIFEAMDTSEVSRSHACMRLPC